MLSAGNHFIYKDADVEQYIFAVSLRAIYLEPAAYLLNTGKGGKFSTIAGELDYWKQSQVTSDQVAECEE